jgi:SAM-dependent methyltransferase
MTESVSHWFEPIANFLGDAYLRYSFTKGTEQEIDVLLALMHLKEDARIIDVGCGPGRHSNELALRGFEVLGVDISENFIAQAKASAPLGAMFERMDARSLARNPTLRETFDAAICLCQGAFGVMRDDADDIKVLRGISDVLRPGGVLALSAFNAYFSIRHHEDAAFDAASGISHETTEIRNSTGETKQTDVWTGCYTPRELRLLCMVVGFEVVGLFGVEPGKYGQYEPSIDLPEYLLVARKPL